MIGTDIQDQQYPSLLFLDIDTTQMVLSMRGEIIRLSSGLPVMCINANAIRVMLKERMKFADVHVYISTTQYEYVKTKVSSDFFDQDGVVICEG